MNEPKPKLSVPGLVLCSLIVAAAGLIALVGIGLLAKLIWIPIRYGWSAL